MNAALVSTPDLRDAVPDAEWRLRVELAACYRLAHHFGMTDLIYTHISARIPGDEHQFLINPFGKLFSEITASSLVRVDVNGRILDRSNIAVNEAGFTIHSAVHMARPDACCVIHTHTNAGMAISALAAGLLPLTQHSTKFYNRLSYHDYEGIALDLGERQRLIQDLGPINRAMILRNHGFLVLGRSVPEAWNNIYYLERASQAQLTAMSASAVLCLIPSDVAEHAASQWDSFADKGADRPEWQALLRFLDQTDASYKT
jgi:ribulose-5-phosphate 4-epimerase/fuculose-1-phosphate aldolase